MSRKGLNRKSKKGLGWSKTEGCTANELNALQFGDVTQAMDEKLMDGRQWAQGEVGGKDKEA